jgi:serine/threonine-protein kinase
MDAGVARTALRRAAAMRDRAGGLAAFEALVQRDPAAFHDPVVAAATRDLATLLALAGGGDTDRVFDALAHRLGSDGLDVLYEIVRLRGGSKAAARAETALREPGAMDRASPALRVTWALRDAPCGEKAALLDKAAAEGDGRTLLVMETIATSCLGPQNEALRAAIKAMKQKGR